MLGTSAIRDAIEDGRIVIKPFNEDQLGPNSYDLRVGEWICRQKPTPKKTGFRPAYGNSEEPYDYTDHTPIDLGDRVNPDDIWDSPTQVPDGIITLRPGELILAHTDEYVLCRGNIVGEMASRSTLMRVGIAVCVDAGLGDVGFGSKWTMEVYNHLNRPISFRVGDRVAQMKFHEVIQGRNGFSDKDYVSKGGTYGGKDWTPEDMLPRSTMR